MIIATDPARHLPVRTPHPSIPAHLCEFESPLHAIVHERGHFPGLGNATGTDYIPILTVEWVRDSIRMGYQLPYEGYEVM